MTLKTMWRKAAVASALALLGVSAQADTYDFELTGSYTASWQLPSTLNPPDFSRPGDYFVTYNAPGEFVGRNGVAETVYFFSLASGGGFELDGGASDHVATVDAQLYTGTEAAPAFKLGTFELTQFDGSKTGQYTLTVSAVSPVSAVPESSGIGLALAGLGVVGGFVVRRRTGGN